MKAKTFLVLLVAAGLLVALAWLHLGGSRMQGPKMGELLFPGLPINQVASVTLVDGDQQTTMTKGEAVWQVDARSGYPADFDTLRDTVVKLSRLKIGRSFAGSPESLTRLALLPPSAADAAARGKQIILKDASGKVLADVILGQARQTDDGSAGGQYLKMADSDTVFLVDGNFRFLKTTPADWLDKEILDIKPAEVESVSCYTNGSETPAYRLTRPKKGSPAILTPVPDGRTVDSVKVDQVMDALAPLNLDDVQPDAAPPDEADPHLVYRLYDGREISLWPAVDDNERYTLRVTVRQIEPVASSSEAEVATPEAGKEEQAATDAADAEAPQTAQQLNAALSPWTFSIKKWQFDSFITQPDGLFEALKKS